MFMNDYDLEQARRRFTGESMPNRLALVMVVDNLREWTNDHSDGWGYWSKPMHAARAAMALIDSSTFRVTEDITDAEMRAAVRPIKAFLTRMAKVTDHRGRRLVTSEDRELILRAVES